LSSRGRDLAAWVAEARAEFDRAFASAAAPPAARREGALAVMVGADRYVLRVSELNGVFVDRPVTWIPANTKAFLGVAVLGTAVLPVWDLRVLLGYPAQGRPRWLASVGGWTVALAFDAYAGHLEPDAGAFSAADPGAAAGEQVREMVAWEGTLLPVLDVERVIRGIGSLVAPGAGQKER